MASPPPFDPAPFPEWYSVPKVRKERVEWLDIHSRGWHRLDGPAILTSDSSYLAWYAYNERHRLDGPAYQCAGVQCWWVRNKRHRLDGPAVIGPDGAREWWINGKWIDDEVEDWCRENELESYKTWTPVIWCLFRLKFSGI